MSPKEKALTSLFSAGVDANNSNAFRPIIQLIEQQPIEAKRVSFTLNEIYKALKVNSKKWEKDIDKLLNEWTAD